MGALDECRHCCVELTLEGCFDLDFEGETTVAAIEDAVRVLLLGLGENVSRQGLEKTPLRVAKALREATKGYNEKVDDIVSGAIFPESGLDTKVGHAGGTGGLVIVRDLNLFSYCESCLLPFHVRCGVGYVPSGQRVVGLSKLSRVAEVFAKRLQDPQRLAHEICSSLQRSFKPAGVAVVLHCSHIHIPDIQSAVFDPPSHQESIKMRVTSGSGIFEDEKADVWMDFFSLVRFQAENARPGNSWCPSHTICNTDSLDPSMLAAVSSIISSLGEDPLRKELVGTPSRFLGWLMNFKNSKLNLRTNGLVLRGTKDPSLPSSNGTIHRGSEEHICSELNLSFWSQCEHHLLPFHGVVHVGYYGSNVVGRSLVESVVHFYGFKLQVQERLTRQIAETVSSFFGEDVIVVVEATHSCMIARGIEKFGSSTATIAVLGRFSNDPSARAKFLQIIPNF